MHTGYDVATKTQVQKVGWFIEESGEVLSAVGKMIRWGVDSYNPELPEEERETNRAWALREISDLEIAIMTLKRSLMEE